MSQPPHRIRRLLLEIQLPAQELAWSVQSDLARIQGESLGPIIDRCCTEVGDPDRVHRIESLEVDLGAIRLESLEQDLIAQLGPRLSEALDRQLRAGSAAPSLAGLPPDAAASLELVAFFVKTGNLPWWADAAQPRAVDKALGLLLQRAAEPLVALVRGLAGEPRALRRLVSHGAAPHIAALFDALVAATQPGLAVRSAEVEGLQAADSRFSMGSPHYRRALWTAALQTASRSDALTDPLSFWRSVILHTALELGQPYSALVTELWAAVDAEPASRGALVRELHAGRVEQKTPGEPDPISGAAPNRGEEQDSRLAKPLAQSDVQSAPSSKPRAPAQSLPAVEAGRTPHLVTQPQRDAWSTEREFAPSPPLPSSDEERRSSDVDQHAPEVMEALRHFPQETAQPWLRSDRPIKQEDSQFAAERSPAQQTEDAVRPDESAQLAEPSGRTPVAQDGPSPLALAQPLRQAASTELPSADTAKTDFFAELHQATRGGIDSAERPIHSRPPEDALLAMADANSTEASRELERRIERALSSYEPETGLPWVELLRHLLARGLLSPPVIEQSIEVLNQSESGYSGFPASGDMGAQPGEASAHPRAAREPVGQRRDAPPKEASPPRSGARAASAALEDEVLRSADLSRALSALLAATTGPIEQVRSVDPSAPDIGVLWLALLRQLLIPGRVPGRALAQHRDSTVQVALADASDPTISAHRSGHASPALSSHALRDRSEGGTTSASEVTEEAPAPPGAPSPARPAPSPPAPSSRQQPSESASHRLAADTADRDQDLPQDQLPRNALAPPRPNPAPSEIDEVGADRAQALTQAQPRRLSPNEPAPLRPSPAPRETDHGHADRAQSLTRAQPRRPSGGPRAPLRPNLAYSETDEVYVENAGLVILWPFLASFFTRLALLDRKQFMDPAALHRAVGLLGYLATGEPVPEEYQLALAKVLCGLDSTEVFEFGPPVTEAEAEECTDLLTAAVASAPILRDMSPEAFRGTFLLRKGVLGTANGVWLLRVERVSYDVVLDRFPWTTNWIKLPWMLSELCVEW